ncbi:persulfide dioxygenase ETHE1, mitochondrial-like [Amphibalanus amphitrite]|uniref:persulfide dioxygenase ETHE1, mitochondrial-like n=1 Tax=Amphibalanus amphitrite TaxID=1232801 RepID=UPI001C914683|nr:persulfide dioxygenase ETHE1, mitochondrial-like [Amphibalanus amphitrite]XP_043202840.1 persulfide dioxygenase ETHE1, mitochondrial-like [Amphibalanus amphitrite]XP_043202841.1 persulfide dioxygenase ETHE1, mitochondrial-like [Amphibalanus amphitrite]XP_043202842.1 persulfide dioxygenase ETHE1, mitochondrial-like [Amphibalanus amphitrite]
MLAMRRVLPQWGQIAGSLVSRQTLQCGSVPSTCPSRLHSTVTAPGTNLVFRQLFDGDTYTYTYLVGDRSTGEAALIDPVIDQVTRDLQVVSDLGLTLKYAVNTHMHADHVTGSGLLKQHVPSCRSVIAAASGARADVRLSAGDIVTVGGLQLETRATPGHTNGCVSYVLHAAGLVFTGDAVLIRGCGRTDFQEGDSGTLYDSVHREIFSLPDHFTVLPAHDYRGFTSSSVAEEKTLNPRLTLSREQFIKFMEDLKLDYPKYIDEALPANRACGLQELSSNHRALFEKLSAARA